MSYTEENLLDCVLLGTHEKQIDSNRVPIKFTVFQNDAVTLKSSKKGKP